MLRRRYQHFNAALGPALVLEIRRQAMVGSRLCAGRIMPRTQYPYGGRHGQPARRCTQGQGAPTAQSQTEPVPGGNVDTDAYAQVLSA